MANCFQATAGSVQIHRVQVHANQSAFRSHAAKQFGGVPGPTDCAIHDNLTWTRIKCGKRVIEQNRPMLAGGCAATRALHWFHSSYSRPALNGVQKITER